MSLIAPAHTELRRPDGTPVRILVVDDDATLAELITMALRYEGWEVRSAPDGRTAVQVARDLRPDAVVLPDFDGLEVLRKLRVDAPMLPVLFLTAKDAVEDRIAARAPAPPAAPASAWPSSPPWWPPTPAPSR
jgi:two-component system OmpR family response regulator